ncbi:ABC transporter substrate-binding protein [Aliikangiella sp. G2MR2-5]|uniref:ABC transporter substrate-binding protein n=1 Tax=Aliikangiella sp. G2MR2-5 TaxID=2788943 RepID=UPI0018AB6B23|nr:ABC transporter substrate-binding protein [Aliikangiella sp. G2MR2-5]
MKFNQHSLLAFIILTLLLGVLFLLGNWQAIFYSKTEDIRIAVSRTPLSAPIYIAKDKGLFDPRCIDVQLTEVFGGKASFEKMIRGEADFATSSESVIAFQSLKRNDFANIATFVQSDNDVKFVISKKSGIIVPQDLVGKKIAVTKGAAGEYFLSIYLALSGVDLKNVEVIDKAPEALAKSLQQGEVDVVVPWEPYAYETLRLSDGDAEILPSKNLYTLTFNLVAKKLNLAAKPQAARCILMGLKKAQEFIAKHPEESRQILIKRLRLDSNFVNWVWQDYIFKLSLSRSLVLNMESQIEWAISQGIVKSVVMPDFEHLIDQEYLMDVVPYAVTLN